MYSFSKSRGQIASIDLLVSILLFVIIFITLRGIWLNNISTVGTELDQFQMQMQAKQSLNVLLNTSGDPTNWESVNPSLINLIGISDSKEVISNKKINSFIKLPYLVSQEKMGLTKYDFNLELFSNETAILSYGMPIDNNSKVVELKRFVVYNGGEALVVFKVFSN